jgi:hypothetical protein
MPMMARGTLVSAANFTAPCNVLGEIADSLEVAGDADGADRIAKVRRHRLTTRDSQDCRVHDFALPRIEARIGRHSLCEHV